MTGGGFSLPVDADDDDSSGDYTALESGQQRPSRVEWVGKPVVAGAPWMRLPLLTVGMLGLQCVWSIEMGYASPWLLELGLSKSMMSLVFVAGPLSGLIVQPLIGASKCLYLSRLLTLHGQASWRTAHAHDLVDEDRSCSPAARSRSSR